MDALDQAMTYASRTGAKLPELYDTVLVTGYHGEPTKAMVTGVTSPDSTTVTTRPIATADPIKTNGRQLRYSAAGGPMTWRWPKAGE